MKNKIKNLLLIVVIIAILPSFKFISSPNIYLNSSEIKDKNEIIVDNNQVMISKELLSNIWKLNNKFYNNQISFSEDNEEYYSGIDFTLDDNFIWFVEIASYTKNPPRRINNKIYFPIEIVEEQNKEFNLLKDYKNNSINIYYKQEENMPKSFAKYEDAKISSDLENYFYIKRLNNYLSNSIDAMNYIFYNMKNSEDIYTIVLSLSDAAKTIEHNKYEIDSLNADFKYGEDINKWKYISKDIVEIIDSEFYPFFDSNNLDLEKLENLIFRLNEKNKELNKEFKLIESKI
ncbi:hypothetical protein [Peptoniphilus stercorisuis]|uniref:Uncharacterized protein n=1 Tax=Peptoniphilus stercorisuis TaxID=1436965 RepID=A0ABS4KAF8_9FIRM|nr:hypothetical protein [Peptoniphilus stercorisuis]MBP2024753.1 hypothetical protein [Peptoniphilus stercorisuis]